MTALNLKEHIDPTCALLFHKVSRGLRFFFCLNSAEKVKGYLNMEKKFVYFLITKQFLSAFSAPEI